MTDVSGRFKIGLFPYFDDVLASRELSVTEFYDNFGPLLNRILRMREKLKLPES